MSRRIDVELTSERDDGTWTWRAAGARQPRGVLDGGLLHQPGKVGDVIRAEADFDVDGITVVAVLPPKQARPEPERLEILGSPPRDEAVTTSLVGRARGDRPGRGPRQSGPGRRPRDDPGERSERRRPGADGTKGGRRGDDDGRRSDGPGGDRARSDRPDRRPPRANPSAPADRRPARAPRPETPARPRPKRLRPGREHRNAVMDQLPVEHRPVAEQVLQGGIPAVRRAVERQNETAQADGRPAVKADALLALAEQLLPRLRTAEWRDRAEAAVAHVDDVDLGDLRSVVVAADVAARDEPTRLLAGSLREALARRVEGEHRSWLQELASTLADGRVVRALRLSSRPPKAGAPLPTDLASRLAQAASAALTADVGAERWATLLDAAAHSPVRRAVTPASIPAEPPAELMETVRRLAPRWPELALGFGVEPAPSPPARPRRPADGRTGRPSGGRRQVPPAPVRGGGSAPVAQEESAPESPPEPTTVPGPDASPEPTAEPGPEPASAPDTPPATGDQDEPPPPPDPGEGGRSSS